MARRLLPTVLAGLGIAAFLLCLVPGIAATGEDKQEKEREVSLDQVPAKVKATILKAAGKAEIKEIEEVSAGGEKYFEAAWMKGGKEVEIRIAPNGKILGREEDEEKEEGKDDEDEEEGQKGQGEVERQVTEAEVPAAALAALKKLAAGAKLTAFSEESEHGHTFYEGSWKAKSGRNVDVLVTPGGDLVEIEESVGADGTPAAVQKAAQKAAGKDAKIAFEKKTMILYEVKFTKGGRGHELLLTPDGRRVEEEVKKAKKAKAGGEDEEADDKDD